VSLKKQRKEEKKIKIAVLFLSSFLLDLET